ncbi:AfsR/SARP family transcriptional regulator [Streptomyces sp. NPDC091292]|uniref:AfsR/SARP family transcriptional regulator n=1 Tax=Streptomyces sp. NPDC091292 TaxID=3365991 RepID=UPI003826CF77
MNDTQSSVRFAVLGPVRAWRGEAELDLGSPQQRAVLATLLLRRGRPVTLSELLDAVWGEEPPPAAVSVLRTYVSRLRKVLEPGRDAVEGPSVVVSVGDGYLLRLRADALDLAVFERRVGEANKARAAGELSAAADLLHAALGEWQGAALAGLPGPLAESEGSRLNQERLSALETRIDIDVKLGRHGEVIAELMALTAKYPLWEQLCRLLMLAFYRSGRQAEALAAYRRTRATLVAELGIEPGAPLKDLHDRILTADASLDADPRPRRPDPPPEPATPDATQVVRPAQLPPALSTFVGRSAELDWSRDLLRGNGRPPSTVLITSIGGMGGVGKSTLAVHWAHEIADRFPGGQLYINLRGFDPTGSAVAPDEAIRVFLDGLGVPLTRMPAGLEARAALYRSMLAERRVLVLLDNARDSDQVRPLLPGSPGCTVIVTSRNRLTGLVAGEGAHPLTLNPMTSAEAHDLLARRLGTARLAAEPHAADEIITRCARLPLALAIVAAHAAAHPGFPLSALAHELRDSHGSLDAFVGGDDLTTDVRAVFSWSYQALSVPAARLFSLLGLHSGPDLSVPAAAALAGLTTRDARRLLTELTRAHLLTEPFPGRYALHDLLRVYAGERVAADETPQERERAVERLLAWYLHTADAAYPLLTPRRRRISIEPPPDGCRPLEFTEQDQALAWCETERVNLVAAVHQAAGSGQPGIAWRLPAVLWGFFYLRGHLHDWLDTARTGLSAARGAHDRPGEAQGLMDTAAALRSVGRPGDAIEELHRAVAGYEELGDTDGLGMAVGNLGDACLQLDRLDEAVAYISRSMDIERASGGAWAKGISLANLGDAYQRLGRFGEAIDCLEQALVILRANDNRWVEGVSYDILGTVHGRLQHYDKAVEYYDLALKTHRDIGNRWGEGDTLSNLGDVRLEAGDPEAAHDSWRQALAIFAEFDHPDAEKVRAKLDGPHGPGGPNGVDGADGPPGARGREAAATDGAA